MRSPLLVAIISLSACGPSPRERDAHIATSTEHCGGELVAPELLMRLSRYQPPMDSTAMWVVQACHPKGGCQPVLTYRHSLPPLYTITGDGVLKIEILGGKIVDRYRNEITIGGKKRLVEIEHIAGSSEADLKRFENRLGLRPEQQGFDLDCDSGLEARLSIKN